ncbi:SpoIVB peptidase S55 [Candidatus Frackibacter sp. WG12]|nr:SpoIVB peptidase S55 [Candidatus Frackibacter sp. WG11]SEM37474.1 SpoIVB peptidase S55 [Candidatus Frackibacter sp. WG12]SFL42956.1 SpoIVB peptidase S55 [Candidatus Frackibacter sp. WG13]
MCLLIITSIMVNGPILAKEQANQRQIMPIEEVQKGMAGIGKTVVSGTEVEEFKVKVLGVLKNKGIKRGLILVRVSGDLIEETGGIAAGMSGSPVYINNKLIGAIGYGWQMTDHKVGLVTPIQDMLDIWKLDQISKKEIAYLSDPSKPIKVADNKVAYPVQAPLLVNGLDGQALNYLTDELASYNLKPIKTGGVMRSKEKTSNKLVPGSAIAVQLVRGDIDVSAIGTLTYKEGNRILGFGHRFMAAGDSNYFLSSAYIHQMIKNLEMPFKLGTPSDLKGIITQDRSAGIGGKVGTFPKVVPLKVTVNDKDLNRTREITVQLIRNEDLIGSLAGSVVYQAINQTIDRRGGGTAQVKMEIMVNNLEENIIQRKNIFYSKQDVASVALNDFLHGLTLISQNPFQKLNLVNINLDISVKEEPQVALIEEVNFLQKKVKPGEKVDFEVKLRPYRAEPIIKKYSFKMPEDIESGVANITLIGGREANFTAQQEVEPQATEYGYGKNENFKNLEEVIDSFKEQKINSDLVIKIMPNYKGEAIPVNGEGVPPKSQQDSRNHANAQKKGNQEQEVNPEYEESFATDYILEGSIDTEIEIKAKEDNQSQSKT